MADNSQNNNCAHVAPSNNPTFHPPSVVMPHMQLRPEQRQYIVDVQLYEDLQWKASDRERYRVAYENKDQEVKKLEEVMKSIETEHAVAIQLLRDRVEKLESKNLRIENDNISLRSYIANLKIADAQTKDDAYYKENLQGLNRMIESSVASVLIDNPSPKKLSKEAGTEMLGVLSEIDPSGKFTATLLQQPSYDTIWTLHQDAHKRVALARHLITLFLWDRVFKPFAFGLAPEQSTLLSDIENSIVENGTAVAATANPREGVL